MQVGFTKSYRSKWDNPVFRNLLEASIWSWMCDTAAWKDTKIRYNGKLITLKRGQLITSLRFISKGFCVGEQVTRTFLENMENEEMINTQPTHRGTIITICNYDKYQGNENQDNTHTNTQLTHSQHTANTNKKEVKKKEVVCPKSFDDFWDVYPRREKKKDAMAIYKKLIQSGVNEKTLFDGAKQYAAHTAGKKKEFIRLPTTWLRGEGWNDEIKVAKRKEFNPWKN